MVAAEGHTHTMGFSLLGSNGADDVDISDFATDRNGGFSDGVDGTRTFNAVKDRSPHHVLRVGQIHWPYSWSKEDHQTLGEVWRGLEVWRLWRWEEKV